MNTSHDTEARPVLVDLQETPEALSVAWRNLFAAAWDAYDRMIERRRAAATAAIGALTPAPTGATHERKEG